MANLHAIGKKNHRIFLILSFLPETIKLLAAATTFLLVNPVEEDMKEYAANISKACKKVAVKLNG